VKVVAQGIIWRDFLFQFGRARLFEGNLVG
jgi:hypothetical protein